MKITCPHDNNTNTCKTCKHNHKCNIIEPTNTNHTLLLKEINYWLKKLKEIKQNIRNYQKVFQDIKTHKYSRTVNVYGNIQYYPLTNTAGAFIRKPEHVIYGWNLDILESEKIKLIDHIRMLTRKELNMRKILLKKSEGVIL